MACTRAEQIKTDYKNLIQYEALKKMLDILDKSVTENIVIPIELPVSIAQQVFNIALDTKLNIGANLDL